MADIELTGIGWDHPRCRSALETVKLDSVTVTWDYRPLADFNDQPLSELASVCDLVIVDYPHVGVAAEEATVVALDEVVPSDVLDDISLHTVGPSYESFVYDGHVWAFPIDAACHLSAARHDGLESHGLGRPSTWHEVSELFGRHPAQVILPFLPADAICCLLSVQASKGSPISHEPTQARFDAESIALLARLRRSISDGNAELSPPEALERLRTDSEIVYCPLLFGYSSYATPGENGLAVEFGPIPGDVTSGVLGGAGIAVSSESSYLEASVAYAVTATSGSAQRSMALAGGQPARREAWDSQSALNPFFSDVRTAMETSWVRPNGPWWGRAQKQLGETLVAGIESSTDPHLIADDLRRIVDESLTAGSPEEIDLGVGDQR